MNEKQARLEKLEREHFYLSMKDHWTAADWEKNGELFREIMKLKEELENA